MDPPAGNLDALSQDLGVYYEPTPWSQWIFSFVFIFGPLFAYYPQYMLLSRGLGEAFSSVISLVLLTSNICRLFFWLGERFDNTLVYQSIVMIFVQLALVEVVTRVRSKRIHTAQRSAFDAVRDLRRFWNWDSFSAYLCFLGFWVGFCGVGALVLIPNGWASVLGVVALSIEATIGLPQVYRNHQKGTAGLSEFLIWSWLVGDVVKTVYYVYLSAPVHFTACGVFQVTVDLFIFWQLKGGGAPGGLGGGLGGGDKRDSLLPLTAMKADWDREKAERERLQEAGIHLGVVSVAPPIDVGPPLSPLMVGGVGLSNIPPLGLFDRSGKQ